MASRVKFSLVLLMIGFVGCATTERAFDFENYDTDIDAYEIDEVDQEPEIINDRSVMARYMNYSEEARRNGIEGRVVIGFIVDKYGKPNNLRILKSLDYDLDIVALNTIANSTFKPARKDGKPVNVKYSLPLDFTLQRSGW